MIIMKPLQSLIQCKLELQKQVNKTPHLQGCKVKAEIEENCIVLSGLVYSYYQKQVAQEEVKRVVQKLDVVFCIDNKIIVNS